MILVKLNVAINLNALYDRARLDGIIVWNFNTTKESGEQLTSTF